MLKRIVLGLVIVMLGIWGLGMLAPRNMVSIMVNGQELIGPFRTAAGVWGMVLSAVVLLCVAILLSFILAGVGLIVLGVLVLAGIIFAALLFPFLLPLLIPLFIVWAFCAGVRRGKGQKT